MNDDAFWNAVAADRHRMAVRHQSLSDQDLARERRAQRLFFPALQQLKSRVLAAAELSALMQDDFRHLLDAIDDNAPTQIYWDEKISSSCPTSSS